MNVPPQEKDSSLFQCSNDLSRQPFVTNAAPIEATLSERHMCYVSPASGAGMRPIGVLHAAGSQLERKMMSFRR
jgi:hypothetical protein